MSAIQSLENAILERIRKQEAFKKEVKAALTRAFNSLPECDSNNEVSNTININKDKFASLLEKLHNDKSLNKDAVQQLIQSTNIKDLKRGSNSNLKTTGSNLSSSSDIRSSNSSYHTANGEDIVYEKPVPVNGVNGDLSNNPNSQGEEFKFGGKRSTRTRRR
jgi:hypothetical protein